MNKVVAAFVGYAPNFEHPFEVSTNHGTALQLLFNDKDCYGFRTTNIPKYYGFVICEDGGSMRYASRVEAFAVATESGQLRNPDELGNSLDSYQITGYDTGAIEKLREIARYTCMSFKDKAVKNVLP